MEIESMNFMESGHDQAECDQVRRRIQSYKDQFNSIRRQIRKLQQQHEKDQMGASHSDLEMQDLDHKVNNQMLRQRVMLEEAKRAGYECEDVAADIKINLKGQTQRMETKTLKNLYDI